MENQIKYPLFFQSVGGTISFKITGDDKGLKIDKHNIMVDPHEISLIVRTIKLQMALNDGNYNSKILEIADLVPLEEEAFNDFYYSVKDQAKKRFIGI